MAQVDIKNLTRRSLPRFAYTAIAQEVLPGWEISLVFIGEKKARDLNELLRGKSYVPNVLSYALSNKNGEIFICLAEASRQAPHHAMSERKFVLYLFIHGLLHLKGMAHGATMEACEHRFLTRFLPRRARTHAHEAPHRNRH